MPHIHSSRTLRIVLAAMLMVLTFGLVVSFVACTGDETPGDETSAVTGSTSVTTAAVTDNLTGASTTDKAAVTTVAVTTETAVETTPAVEPTEEMTQVPTEPVESTVAVETTVPPETTEEPVTDVINGPVIEAEYAADFSVSNVFSSDMVVQRGEHIRVWGTAPVSENGKKISGEFMGMTADALIEDGEWILTFGARLEACADLGNSMRLYAGDNKEVIFTDVLVGDVYMVIGQSNVAYSVAAQWGTFGADGKGGQNSIDEEAPIRIHYNGLDQTNGYPTRGTEEVCAELCNGSTWKRATKNNIRDFTAIGYYFAYHFIDMTDNSIPVGIIEINGNGQPLGAFLPNEVAEEFKSDRYNSDKGYYVTSGVNADAGRYMYNHYMAPFEKYAMAGVVWYQGESDYEVANARTFARKFTALMTYMRSTHNLVNEDFPVYIVEFPTNYQQHPDFVPSANAAFWAAMDVGLIRAVVGSIPQMLPNSYLSVSSDLWLDDTFWNTLHPNCKYEQGERLAGLACAHLGLNTPDEVTGPILESAEFSEDKKTVVLTFSSVGEGLATDDGSDIVKGFMAITLSYSVVDLGTKMEARITAPNQITITSSAALPGIAYNAVYYNVYGEQINLCNSNGIPAGAFLVFKS